MNLNDYIEKNPKEEKKLLRMEKTGTRYEAFVDLKEHPAMKEFLKDLERRKETINTRLLNERMTEKERDLLFMERDCWEYLKQTFDGAEVGLALINKYLEKL